MECCKGCMVAMQLVSYSNPFEFADALNNGTLTEDIIFPVLASMNTEKMMGYYFVPFFKMPMLSVIIKRKTYSEIMTDLILSCLSLWPLLSICLLMALIAGFLMWIMVMLIIYFAPNLFQPSAAFHIEISHLICSANQMTGLYMKRNTGLKWFKKMLNSCGISIKTIFILKKMRIIGNRRK